MTDLFEEQARVHSRNRRRRIAIVVLTIGCALLPLAAMYHQVFSIPISLVLLKGASVDDVRNSLGEPERSWTIGNFECYPKYPCTPQKAVGAVFFYWRAGIGHYVYFDANERMSDFDSIGS